MTTTPSGILLGVGPVSARKAKRFALSHIDSFGVQSYGSPDRGSPDRYYESFNLDLIELWWMSEDIWSLGWLEELCEGDSLSDWEGDLQFLGGATIPHRTDEDRAEINLDSLRQQLIDEGISLSIDSDKLEGSKRTLAYYLAGMFTDDEGTMPDLYGVLVDAYMFNNPDSRYLLEALRERSSGQVAPPWIFLTTAGRPVQKMPLRDYGL